MVALDNVSTIRPWLSDALCRAATGDGWVDRALYTDSELAVLRFLRVVLLTSIDAGALRGDLGDRIVLADLERIPKQRRRPKRELDERYRAARPRLFGALLDLHARVLAELSHVETRELPCMADYARVLAALDAATGSNALSHYIAQGARVAEEVAEGDPVARALIELGEWSGTAGELLELLTPEPPARAPQGWPATARKLSGRLERLAPTLQELGVEVIAPAPAARPRVWTLRPIAHASSETLATAYGLWAQAADRRADRRPASGADDGGRAASSRSDGPDGSDLAMEPEADIPPADEAKPSRKRWGAGAEASR